MKSKIEIMTYSLEEIKTAYKDYLNKQGLSRLTIQTALSDSFYIWKKRGSETFWNIIFSEDFEKLGERILLQTLREYSKGDVHKNVNSYMSHLRRFRKFLTGVPTKDLQTLTPRVTLVTKNKPRKVKQDLSDPCKEQVDFYLKRWDLLEDYHLQENALDKLFFELCPGNKDILDVLLKVAALNDFYSTHIYKVFPMAKHIVSLDIDDRLKTGDLTLVRDIQKVNGINHYSFATKYCSHHRPLDFPIYDSFVDDVLCYFRKRDGFFGFDSSDLKDFALFKDILLAFRSFYGLEAFNLKQIDKYIWQLGKDYFPRNYK